MDRKEKKRKEEKRRKETRDTTIVEQGSRHFIIYWMAGWWAGWVGWRADLRAAGVAGVAGLRAGQPVCGRKGIHPATAGNAGTAQKQFETI